MVSIENLIDRYQKMTIEIEQKGNIFILNNDIKIGTIAYHVPNKKHIFYPNDTYPQFDQNTLIAIANKLRIMDIEKNATTQH